MHSVHQRNRRRQRDGLQDGLDEHGERAVAREGGGAREGRGRHELQEGGGGKEGGGQRRARTHALHRQRRQREHKRVAERRRGVRQRGEQRFEGGDDGGRGQRLLHVLRELLDAEQQQQHLALPRRVGQALLHRLCDACRDLSELLGAPVREGGEVAAVGHEALGHLQSGAVGELALALALDVLHVERGAAEAEGGAHERPVEGRGGVEAVERGEEDGAAGAGEGGGAEEAVALELEDERGRVGGLGGDHEDVLEGDGAVHRQPAVLHHLQNRCVCEEEEAWVFRRFLLRMFMGWSLFGLFVVCSLFRLLNH